MQTPDFSQSFFTESREALIDRLAPATSRIRKIQFWRIVVVVAIGAAIVAVVLIAPARSGVIDGVSAALLVSGVAIACLLIALVVGRATSGNLRAVAQKIEARFPSLQQRLLTALSQSSDDGEKLGYLQQRVIREAREHSRAHRWVDAVPHQQLWYGRLLGAIATVGLILALGILASTSPTGTAAAVASSVPPQLKVTVIPGNTEVERGSSLVVTARFDRGAPDEAVLQCRSHDGEERRITMTQNLDDPVLGGFVASIDREFDYQVITDNWTSDVYSVGVFEFPALVRSDANLQFPEYTGMEEKRIEDTVRVSAVEGTKVKWICFLNKPVDAADLVAKDGSRIELTPDEEAPNAWSTEIDLRQTQKLTLEMIDDQGRENKYPPELIARVLPNNPPKLKLTEARDVSVSPLEELPLGVEVRDDFGIKQVGISFSFGDQLPEDLPLEQAVARGVKKKVGHLVEFEELKAEPDQLFSYHFWAEDFGPDGKVRRTESDMFFAEVRHFEEIYREGQPPPGGQQQGQQSQNGQQAEKLAELQKEIINATWKVLRDARGANRSDEFELSVELLKESQTDALELLEELAQNVQDGGSRTIVDGIRTHMTKTIAELTSAASSNSARSLNPALVSEKASYADLLKLRAREFEITRQQQQQRQQSGNASQRQRQQQLDDLELKQDDNRYETQQQAQENSQEEQQEREMRQVLNRLRELARRQEDLNKQLAQLQSALEQAETEEEKDEIERQLKRLREQQQDLLRETDELNERMQQPENQEQMSEASEQLEQTRENVRKASEALEKNDASQALTAGRRAEREFQDLRDEFRKQTAGQFNDAVRDMRSTAQELDEKESEIAEQLKNMKEKKSAGLRGEDKRGQLQEQLTEQRENLDQLLEQMEKTVEEAETSEPLLAQKLYDSYRKTQQRQVDQKLGDTGELLRRGFDAEAREFEKSAREGIGQLREELEDAASSVLGDETEGLRRALSELDQLARDLENEIDREDPNVAPGRQPSSKQSGQNPGERSGQPGQQSGESEQQDPEGQPRGGQDAERQQQDGQQPNSEQQGPGQQPGGQSPSDQESDQQQDQPRGQGQGTPQDQDRQQVQRGQGQQQSDQQQGNQPGQGQNPDQQQSESQQGQPGQQPGQEQGQQNQQDGQPRGQRGQNPGDQQTQPQQGGREGGILNRFAANSPSGSPITGDGFREWTDRLRDVEEMVEDPELRSDAARIRDRIRDARIDYRRDFKPPQWRLVEKMIAEPLRELRRNVQEELLRRSAEKNALVPIDRDPVPDQFTDALQKYYENLGSGR